jgi:membrane protease YdiL (CAAX protease family)
LFEISYSPQVRRATNQRVIASSTDPQGEPPLQEPGKTPWLRPELIAPWWEIVLVLAVMLGPFVYSSTHYVLTNGSDNYLSLMLTNHKFLGLIATESCLLAVMFGYLRWRGWKPSDFRIHLDWMGTVEAPVVALGAFLTNFFVVAVLIFLVLWLAPHPGGMVKAFIGQAPKILPHSIVVSWFFIVAGPFINAFLEELVFMGYGFNQFAAKRGPFFAVGVMVLLRMLLHTYQGPVHVIGIGAFSIFFGLAYWLLRRLWPLIMAHAVINIFSFATIKILFGR